ncbi:MAG: hypothetical protein ACE5G9_02575 [Nitrospinales bacterium]
MTRTSATVEQVREGQEYFKKGMNLHEAKSFKEAIEIFKKCALINPYDPAHVDELTRKLKQGSYKLLQESVAYMGCAAVHLNKLIGELDDRQKEQVPLDPSLSKVFSDWE